MIYSIPAKSVHFPISLDRPATRPVSEIAQSASAPGDENRRQPSTYVYRGEVLETAAERSYRRPANLQISPENQRAIQAYLQVAEEQPFSGVILDGYI